MALGRVVCGLPAPARTGRGRRSDRSDIRRIDRPRSEALTSQSEQPPDGVGTVGAKLRRMAHRVGCTAEPRPSGGRAVRPENRVGALAPLHRSEPSRKPPQGPRPRARANPPRRPPQRSPLPRMARHTRSRSRTNRRRKLGRGRVGLDRHRRRARGPPAGFADRPRRVRTVAPRSEPNTAQAPRHASAAHRTGRASKRLDRRAQNPRR